MIVLVSRQCESKCDFIEERRLTDWQAGRREIGADVKLKLVGAGLKFCSR